MEGLDNKNIEGKIEFVLVVHMGATHLPTWRNGLQQAISSVQAFYIRSSPGLRPPQAQLPANQKTISDLRTYYCYHVARGKALH